MGSFKGGVVNLPAFGTPPESGGEPKLIRIGHQWFLSSPPWIRRSFCTRRTRWFEGAFKAFVINPNEATSLYRAVIQVGFCIDKWGKEQCFAQFSERMGISDIKTLPCISQFHRNSSCCNVPFQRGECNTNNLSSVGTIHIKSVLPC